MECETLIESPMPHVPTQVTVRRALLVGIVAVLALLGLARGIVIAFAAANPPNGRLTVVPVSPTENYPSDWLAPGPVVTIDADTTLIPTGTVGGVVMVIEHPDSVTAVLAAVPVFVPWLTGGAIGLLALPLVRSIAAGRPFALGNARALAEVAGVAVLAGAAATVLPYLAAGRAVTAEMAGLPADYFTPRFEPIGWPWGLAVFAIVLALAVWQGSRVSAETEGLV
jgi:hypothetical protein